MNISIETPKQADIMGMLEQLDAYLAALYPAESNHLMSVDSLMSDDVVFVVARDEAGQALACGAVVTRDGYGEIKRMFVTPAARGTGLGRKVLADITERAASAGTAWLKLETGIWQPEAIGLYERAGFVRCPPFGDYLLDPLSLFMEKELTGA